jgi:cobalt-zinc-cadmium efflux system outer membrane protein
MGVVGKGRQEGRPCLFSRGRAFNSRRMIFTIVVSILFCLLVRNSAHAVDATLNLQTLLREAMSNNHEILMAESRLLASRYRIPQATNLPDPMFMFGYQNEGFKRYTYGEMQGAQWMFSASQMFPFPGKLSLKGEMAKQDTESLKSSLASIRLKTVVKVKELYYDLFLAYKNIELIRDRTTLFSKIEDVAVARYSSGMGLQQEVLMAQIEKYMLLEKEEMQGQKLKALEAMLKSTIGKDMNYPLGIPSEPVPRPYGRSFDELVRIAYERSPEIQTREKMIAVAETKVESARREYYPDFTLNASYFKRSGEFLDMWSLTTAINIPIFYKTKQRQAVLEAQASLSEAIHELEAAKTMLSATMRENFSMLKASEKLMELYRGGLIPKAHQDFEAALSGYVTGKVEALTVISRMKTLLDVETSYWAQVVEREKALARLGALAGFMDSGGSEQ